jgi:hypothetical protein
MAKEKYNLDKCISVFVDKDKYDEAAYVSELLSYKRKHELVKAIFRKIIRHIFSISAQNQRESICVYAVPQNNEQPPSNHYPSEEFMCPYWRVCSRMHSV